MEPGLYFPTDDPELPEWCRGIGIRIEDDVLVAPAGQPPQVCTRTRVLGFVGMTWTRAPALRTVHLL